MTQTHAHTRPGESKEKDETAKMKGHLFVAF